MMRVLVWTMAAVMIAASSATALTVRVQCPDGAPRIAVDGKPVRARMFWGAPGPAPIDVPAAGRVITFDFTALDSEPDHATMHFRFGAAPGVIDLDNIRVTDLDTHKDVIPTCTFEGGDKSFTDEWTHWPTKPQNTVGSIRVDPHAGEHSTGGVRIGLAAPPDGHWPDFHIYHLANLSLMRGHHYRVSFWAKATPARQITVAFYRPGDPYVYLGGPAGPFESQIRLAADAGVNFVSFPVSLPWPKPGEATDWTEVDRECQRVLDANPNALLLPRVPMDPPPWWRAAHPDDVMRWEDGSTTNCAAVASPLYRHDAAERLAAYIDHVEAKFGDHVAGYHPDGQNTGEWFYRNTWGHLLNGYSPATRIAWRAWLKQQYGDDAALRKAWHDDAATIDHADVPPAAKRHATPDGILRDPAREQALIDFAAFQQQAMAECVCAFAHAARQATHGRKLVVFFYGYVFEFGPVGNGPATSGHYALRRVLDCPDIDILCSPIAYFDRGLGGSAPAMTAAESVALAHKMWLYEDDTATYLSTGDPPGSTDRVHTLTQTNDELMRNVAEESLRNFGTWWMDLTRTGWFNDPAMWRCMSQLKPLDDAMLATPTPFHPAVAAVLDEPSVLHVAAGGDAVTRPVIYNARTPLARLGAPYGQYLMSDVIAGRVKAKLYVMLDAWALPADRRRALLQHTDGATRLWCYAPGYIEGNHTSLDAMHQLTGFTLKPLDHVNAIATPTALGRSRGLTESVGEARPIHPLFYAADAKPDEVLATYSDGSAAVAMRHTDHGTSIFVGPPQLTSELLRLAAREAGVHLFTTTDCIVYANGLFVALHACNDGPVILHTGEPSPVIDMITGKTLGPGPDIPFDLHRGDTRVLKYR